MDLAQKARELEIEESLYVSLLNTFEERLADDLSALERSIVGSDLDAIYAAAHSIKGASASLCLWPIYEAASEICSFAREGKVVSIDPQLSVIREETDILSRLLRNRAGGVADGP